MKRRLLGLIRKEMLQIFRDPSSIAIAFVLPAFLLLLFGYGVSMDAKNLPIAIVIEQPGQHASSYAAAFEQSPYFMPRRFHQRQAAIEALREREVDGIVILGQNFEADFSRFRNAQIQVIANGVDANSAQLLHGYVEGLTQAWLMHEAAASGRPIKPPVQLEARIWFNPELRSRSYLVPGLLVVNMTLVGALLTALVMAREYERGTLEALLVTPVTLAEILIGKILPYFVLGMGGMVISVVMAIWLFEVPLRGSWWLLFISSSLFLITALGMGLLISIVARIQFVAGMIAIVATFLPAFLLSGFLFDIHSMPAVIQAITHVVAARYFVAIVQSLFLAGDVWSVILPNLIALLIMAIVFLGLARRRISKRLE